MPAYTNATFVKPLIAEFGWSLSQVALATTLSVLAVGLMSPLLGVLVDRVGSRRLAAAGLLCVSAGFAALSQQTGGIAAFIGVHVLLAVLGAGASPVTLTRAVADSFDRARGLALGLALAGSGITGTFAPPLVGRIVGEEGWRAGYVALALTALAAAPVVWLLLGRGAANSRSGAAATTPHTGATVGEARRTLLFWRLFAAFLLLALAVAGFLLHLTPMLIDAGLSPARAAAIQGMLGLSVLAGRLAVGWLVDRFFAPNVAAVMLMLAALGVAAFALGGVTWAVPAALLLGFAFGAEVDLIAYLASRYFGLRAYGAIYGWQYGAFMIGSAMSPLLIAVIATGPGGYTLALGLSAAMLVAVAIQFASLPRFELLRARATPA